MRKHAWTALTSILAVVLSLPATAEGTTCSATKSLDEQIKDATEAISEQFNRPTPGPRDDEDVGEETRDELARRASGDGLADGRLDQVRRLFLALDLGDVKEEDDSLIFNFNPVRDSFGRYAPRAIVHQPTVFAALAAHVEKLADADARAARRKALEEGLGELDDVELRLRWTPPWDTPERRISYLTNPARDIFEEAWTDEIGAMAGKLAEDAATFNEKIKASLREEAATMNVTGVNSQNLLETPMSVICTLPRSKELVDDYVAGLQEGKELLAQLHSLLTDAGFFALADLLEEEAQWSVDGSYRQRAGVVGPDEGGISVRYQLGGWRLLRFMGGNRVKATSGAEMLRRRDSSLPTFSVKVDASWSDDFTFSLPEEDAPFEVDPARRISGVFTAGGFVDKARQRRWEAKATYDDISDDPTRQDRFVGTLSWVQKLSPEAVALTGGSELVLSFVYANKPEFRGEVDEDFGVRAGLKWSLGDGSSAK